MFNTNANTGFNSFGPPTNIWGAGQGWGLDTNYLTPAFTAPYRPPYSGGQTGNQNPGFFQSAYGLSPFNFRGSPYGVNVGGDEANYWNSIHNVPSDFGMSAAQRIGVPLLAFGGAMAFAKSWQVPMGTDLSSSMVRGWNRMWGGAATATQSGFTGMGAKFAGGAAEGMLKGMFGRGVLSGAGVGSSAARGAVMLAGGVGAAAFGIGAPLLLAQGAISAFDSLVSDNYIGMRENTNVMRNSFSGISLGGGFGDSFSGRGLGREVSARMGTEMTKFGAKDQLFNAREIASMGSMASQMGLLDNVSGEQLTSRMKSIVNQVKMVMSIAGTTEFKDAIQIMAKLQMAGVGPGNIAGVFAGIGSLSSQAGINVNRMINTVGAQGQYLFQANGLTPYVGQITAANAMAGFAGAFRSGFIGPELMARMGGVEGATQSSMTGQLNAAQTTYNTIRGFNMYTSGRGGAGGVVENISRFGETFAGDPLSAYGALHRTGRANVSRMMEEQGPLAIYNQVREIADINPLIGKGKKMNQDQLFALLMPMMGNDPRQVEAYMSELATYQDPKSMAMREAGARSARINREKDFLSQTEQTFGMTLPFVQGSLAILRGVRKDIAGGLGIPYQGSGGLFDYLNQTFSEINYGRARNLAGGTASELAALEALPDLNYRTDIAPTSERALETESYNRALHSHRMDIRKLVRMAEEDPTNPTVRRAMKGDVDAIQKLGDRGVLSGKYSDPNDAAQLAQLFKSLPKEAGSVLDQRLGQLSEDLRSGIFGKQLTGKMGGASAKFDETSAIQKYHAAFELRQKLATDKDLLENSPEALAKAKELFGDIGIRDLEKSIKTASLEAGQFGLDMSERKRDRRPNEGLADYYKDVNMRFNMRTENRSINADEDVIFKSAQARSEDTREQRRREQTRQAMINMGRIDMVAAMDMQGAAKDLKEAAGLQKQAATLVIDKLGKEGITGQPGNTLNTAGRTWSNLVSGKIRGQ